MGDSRDCLDNSDPDSEYGALKQQFNAVERMLRTIGKHVLPGEVDSIDAMALIIKERDELKAILSGYKTHDQMKVEIDELKAEVERLKGEIEDRDKQWKPTAIDLSNKVRSLELLAESYRGKLSNLVNALELVNPISAHVEAAFNEAKSALKEQGDE
jgi:chromosome segregation ATPase